MAGVWYRARAELRHRWLATAALTLFVAVPGALVLASAAGARRGDDALPRFLSQFRASDALVFIDGSPEDPEGLRERIAALPQWEATDEAGSVVLAVKTDGRWAATVAPVLAEAGPGSQNEALVVDGRAPDPEAVEEIAVNEAFALGTGLGAGDQVDLRTVTPAALEDVANGLGDAFDPNGETVEATIAGVVRTPVDLRLPVERPSTTLLPESWRIELGPAFVARFGDDLAHYGFGVAGRVRPGQLESLGAEVARVGGNRVNLAAGDENEAELSTIERGIGFETSALLVFALLAAVTTVALVGQAVNRQAQLDLRDDDALRSAGLTRRERTAVPIVRSAVIAAAGSAGAVALAIPLSGLFPIGLARRADVDPGLDVDAAVLVPGAVALAATLVLWATVTSWRATRPGGGEPAGATRAGSVSTAVAAAGAPVTVVAGARLALERGHGRTAVPVLGAFLATTAGVLVLCGVLVFGASLDHLVATPELQGWRWDVAAGNFDAPASVRRAERVLREAPEVKAYVGLGSGPAFLDGQDGFLAFAGPGDVAGTTTVLEGRLPGADDEMAVGVGTLADLGKEIGDRVDLQVSTGLPVTEMRIVGTIIPPATTDTQLSLSRGAVITLAGARAAYPDGGLVPQVFLVRFTPGTSIEDGTDALLGEFGDTVSVPPVPGDVANLSRVQRLPRILAGLVALLALGSLANALVTSVRRHRRDLATLATLGFRRRQLAATVAWQSTTFAVLALAVGIPLGVAFGRTVWWAVMDSVGVAIAPSVPLLVIAGLAGATLVAANAIAALPARSAARTHPAQVLRSE